MPEATTLEDQLEAFLKRKTHFALVVDEYGEVMGLVTLEDILEEIVGDIRDEHDLAVQGVRPQPDGSVLVDGAVPVRDLNRVMAWSLPDEEATTIAGLVIHEAGAIPEAGQVFTFHGFRFEVMRKIRNRVTALRVTPQEAARGNRGDDRTARLNFGRNYCVQAFGSERKRNVAAALARQHACQQKMADAGAVAGARPSGRRSPQSRTRRGRPSLSARCASRS